MSAGGRVAAAMMVQNIGAYGFNLVAARILDVPDLGALTALLGVILVANVGMLAVQTTTARRIAVKPDDAEAIAGRATVTALVIGLAATVVVALASPVLAPVLQLDSVWPLVLCGATVLPLTLMGAAAGVAQGQQRWGALSVIYVANGVGRVVLGTAAILVVATPTAAIAGVLVGAWVPVLAGIRLLHLRHVRSVGYMWEVAAGSHAMLAFLVLSNLDALLGRAVLTEHESGLYGAGLILTKAALFLPQFVAIVVFPRLAKAGADRARSRAVAAVAVLGLIATAMTALLPWLALILVGGDKYVEVEGRLWLFALEGSVLALVQLLVFDALARRSHTIVALLWGASVVVGGVTLLTPIGITGLTLTMTLTASVVAAIAWVLAQRPVGRPMGRPVGG
ncbi:O-antigen/teichoic acid export membrane protein [Mumia flava]|uniref:O-antigen/teichoic acid export membrane protein n=1 Tax=Mumia flava TaxID=1348852 RepID=A0A2M9BDC9_9ACTN|nr:O-antigen/teichoic acid export membrane protein [Mumia flava]